LLSIKSTYCNFYPDLLPITIENWYVKIGRAFPWTIVSDKFGEKKTMSSFLYLAIHSSQFPQKTRRDLLESLRRRQVNHKFHYDSVKQTQKWLVLHQAFSPSRADKDCAAIYDRSYEAAARLTRAKRVHVIGLGCGGGQKDERLLRLLKSGGREVFYTPCDVSAAMVLVAQHTARAVVPERNCFPLVCDLATSDDLPDVFEKLLVCRVPRLLTFFGMIPNFEPHLILSKLAALIRPGDVLLFSANLAPGSDYEAGMKTILPQYNNALTRDWLMTFPLDLGIEREDGELRFGIEADPAGSGLKRVTADFHFLRPRQIQVDTTVFKFRRNEILRLFFSYRYTPALARSILQSHGLKVLAEWITGSDQEGVFLCCRGSRPVRRVNRKS
jgi:uncharacterized SAM-dependent methyltransferase